MIDANQPELLWDSLERLFFGGAAAQSRAGRSTHSTDAPNAAASPSTHRLAAPNDEQFWVAGARRDLVAEATKATSTPSPFRRSIHAKSLSSFAMLKPYDVQCSGAWDSVTVMQYGRPPMAPGKRSAAAAVWRVM